MSVKTIIEEAKKLSKEEKQQIAYYFLVSTLNEDKRNDLMQLFIHSFNLDIPIFENKKKYRRFDKYTGKIKISNDFDEPIDDFNDYMY